MANKKAQQVECSQNTEKKMEERKRMIEGINDIEKSLPEMLKEVTNPFDSAEEKMIVLTATIVEAGALFPNAWFNYDGKKTYPMLMVMFVAPPASGKGVLSYPKRLLSLIDTELRKKRNYVPLPGRDKKDKIRE